MHEIIVRQADKRDLDALCRLYLEFHEFHVRGIPARLRRPVGYDNDELCTRIEKVIGSSDSVILVIEADSRVVGFAEVYMKQDEANQYRISYRYGHLQSMMVSEGHRKRKLGRQLLEAAEQWAKERNADEMRLDIWEFKEGPLRFYKKSGYQTLRRMLMRKL
ncbi:hypothetical protein AMJ83_01955 [candidate division WOR_3 bacterium SM23_42]|uniref:N-acetyltransferase domain-containing protein n=1 Tax=candidate division WOR_3 bacterium SM23_42 TaxID=1703779 RepID=A0A0S8FVY2_UNCW3|nr:MAG: hypothetical protein AMJ83_01955 [candidate division WOR_3 bacterium SM23_42]